MELKTLEIKNVEYTPYGELWEEQKSDVFDRIPFRFTGKELDTETALYYVGARYMDPRTSRWISSDPTGMNLNNPMEEPGKPRQGYSIVEATNWYSYVSNNPITYFDPTGFKQHNNITLTFYRHDESSYSRGDDAFAGMDYAVLENT
ncbi:MAG: RHS repeat-associated core domain-containing protein, partial [Spirochaetales bacterium]|nr:RHS repeat-associated core domain-containing protein [Spirochaetales bacterium]